MSRKKIIEQTPSDKTTSAKKGQSKDDTAMSLIRGLDFLITKANTARLATAAGILHRAKEELIYWAVDFDFHESKQDTFIYNNLYNTAGFQIADFIAHYAAIQDSKTRRDFLKGLEALRSDYTSIAQVVSDG